MTADPMTDINEPDPFEDPGSSSFIDKDTMKRLNGSLLVMMPTEFKDHFPTKHTKIVDGKQEKAPAVKTSVYVVDSPDADMIGQSFEDCWMWQAIIVSSLKDRLGTVVPCVLGQGENKKGNPPWLLNKVEPGSPERTKALAWYKAWKAEQERDPFSEPEAVKS